MTKEFFLKELLDSELLRSVELAPDFKEFIYARMNTLSVSKVSEEYRRYEAEKRSLEENFISLFADPTKGQDQVNRYIDVNTEAESLSNFYHYQKGFYEGIRAFLSLISA
ncbi:MAG TPA: hypothetical protein VHY08_28525 [Bacillota bacterium]|nr:hypothetical protein [Bacillota bacterium]